MCIRNWIGPPRGSRNRSFADTLLARSRSYSRWLGAKANRSSAWPCLRPLSTAPAADIEMLFRWAMFAWLIADGDMHLKNVALLKIAEPGARVFASVRLAPLYDPVTTPPPCSPGRAAAGWRSSSTARMTS